MAQPAALTKPTPRCVELEASEAVDLDPLASPALLAPALSKSKLRRLRRREIRLQSFTLQDAERTLLSFIGSINGHPARILIDGGAEGDVISSSFQKRYSIPLRSCKPIPIVVPDGSFSISSHTASITLQRDTYSATLDPFLYPLKKYDLILGKPWLTRTNPLINWRTNGLHFDHEGTAVHWECRGHAAASITSTSRGLLMSHMHFHTLAMQPENEVFLALVKIHRDEPETAPPAALLPTVPSEIAPLVKEFADVFPVSLPAGLPPDRGDSMKIETDPYADPPVRPVIRLSIAELDELRKQLDDLLAKGFIKPSTSPYGAPVLFVKKKDGSLRLCVDYRGLNRITRKNRHPLPRIDELIDRFRGAEYFTKLDLLSGYHQQRIFEPHTHKTAFRCRYGHFEFNVVPFGLTNAPASFSRMMFNVLDPVLDKWVVVYLDDILIYSRTKAEHLAHVRSVLTLLRKNGLYAKLSKCSFMQEQTEFLGHVISKKGIHTNAGLVKAIRDWPRPTKQREVQQFVGLAQFYHQYIDNFAEIALPLTALIGEGVPFSWSEDAELAFAALKDAISKAPVLKIFDPDHRTTVETDASGFALGAVLFQTDEHGVSRPVAFTSRKLNSAERNYPTHEQELLAVVHALKTWRYYLDGTHFIVYTDHATLRHFPTQPKLTRRQARWMELLQEYDFDFKYKKGSDNIVPDALSRRPDHQEPDPPEQTVNNVEITLDQGLRQRLIDSYEQDSQLGPIYESCLQGSCPPRYSLVDNLLCITRNDTTLVCIPRKSDIRLSLLHDAHDAAIAGHLGFEKTYDAVRRSVYWPRIARDTKEYVATCESCQRNKASHQRPAGLLQPLESPSQRWETVTMDFIVQLPKTARGSDSVVVFVDKLSKQVHFVANKTTDSAADVARLFFDNVFRLHGMPTTIVSDRDTKFTSRFWKELHRLMDTKLAMSTAFHPQTDGQTERANQTLESILRAFVNQRQSNWDLLLSSAEFAYNNATNASTGYSPFFLNSGIHPRVPSSLLQPQSSTNPTVQEFLDEQSSTLILAKEAIEEAQERQARNADAHRRDHGYKVGDQVLLNTENVTVEADRNRPTSKLSARFVGPYTIAEQHTPVSFRLELPPQMKIHDIFHVDRFRPYHPSPESLGQRTHARPPPDIVEGQEEFEAESILEHRTRRNRREFLVLWKGYPHEDATWEPASNLTHSPLVLQKYKRENRI
jgi:RNase H-like domain found in reverse transcriptase/Reverse transcriptase (RNA-dependent DNA polymerase)/Integrase zinc binding domain/Chromo (CHRromatin Organisation MOdifier) domain/Retroviral aspartyl protease